MTTNIKGVYDGMAPSAGELRPHDTTVSRLPRLRKQLPAGIHLMETFRCGNSGDIVFAHNAIDFVESFKGIGRSIDGGT
jgi:hypothetical protein